MPSLSFDCRRATDRIPLLQKDIFSIKQLGTRVIRSSVVAAIITLISHSITLHGTVKDFRVMTPLIFAIWTSSLVCLLGVVGGYYQNVAFLSVLTLFAPMSGAAVLPLSYTISFMHLSMCLATPWSYQMCEYLPCMNADRTTWQFKNECSLEDLKSVGCPMLPGDSCQIDDLKEIISEKNRIIDILSFCASFLPAAYAILMLIRIETSRRVTTGAST